MSERQYRVEGRMNGLMVLCALIGGAAGIGTLATPFLDPQFREPRWLIFVFVTGPIYLVAGWYCLRIRLRAEEYGVVLGPAGFRRLADPPSRLISWSRVARLRERRMANRVELLDNDGRVLGRLEYQLDGFEEALASVLALTGYDRRLVPLPHRIEAGGTVAGSVAWCLMGGFVVYCVLSGLLLPGLLPAAVLGWAFLKDRRTVSLALDVDPGTVRMTTAAGTHSLPLEQIRDVRVVRKPVGNGGYLLDVAVVAHRGDVHLARPGTADPFLVWTTLKTAQRHAMHGENLPVDALEATPAPQPLPHRTLVYGAALLIIVGLTAIAITQGGDRAAPIRVGARAPQFPARDLLTNREVYLSEPDRSRTTVLSFWAHDCTYCRSQLRALDSVRQLVDSSRVCVVAIHLSHDRAAAARLGGELGLGIALWYDVEGLAERRYGIDGTPATLVIDSVGCVRYFITGTGGVEVRRLALAAEQADARAGTVRGCESPAETPPPVTSELASATERGSSR